jgi:hypothetical protein
MSQGMVSLTRWREEEEAAQEIILFSTVSGECRSQMTSILWNACAMEGMLWWLQVLLRRLSSSTDHSMSSLLGENGTSAPSILDCPHHLRREPSHSGSHQRSANLWRVCLSRSDPMSNSSVTPTDSSLLPTLRFRESSCSWRVALRSPPPALPPLDSSRQGRNAESDSSSLQGVAPAAENIFEQKEYSLEWIRQKLIKKALVGIESVPCMGGNRQVSSHPSLSSNSEGLHCRVFGEFAECQAAPG